MSECACVCPQAQPVSCMLHSDWLSAVKVTLGHSLGQQLNCRYYIRLQVTMETVPVSTASNSPPPLESVGPAQVALDLLQRTRNTSKNSEQDL